MLYMVPCRLSEHQQLNDRLVESQSKVGFLKCLACDNLNITTNSLRSLDSYMKHQTPIHLLIHAAQATYRSLTYKPPLLNPNNTP